jgi:hypothetical protein
MTRIGVLLLVSLAARAESVTTPLFVINVPDGWHIEDNKSSVVLIMGDRVRDGAPLPFLSVQYCVAIAALEPALTTCPHCESLACSFHAAT